MKTLLLDIETAPHRVYAWGLWDQNIYLDQIEEPGYTLCWAAKWYGDDEVVFDSCDNEHFIHNIFSLIEEADAVVHYNGTKFDMPILNQEFLLRGMPKPAPYKQIDLLRVARKQFRLPSNKLDYVAKYLGFEGKHSHKGMQLWRECMAGDAKAWDTMKRYNIQDVKLLEKIYTKLLPWTDGHPNVGLYSDTTDPVCSKCGSAHLHKRGLTYTSTMVYQRYQCQKCGSWMRSRTNVLSKEKRQNLLTEAR